MLMRAIQIIAFKNTVFPKKGFVLSMLMQTNFCCTCYYFVCLLKHPQQCLKQNNDGTESCQLTVTPAQPDASVSRLKDIRCTCTCSVGEIPHFSPAGVDPAFNGA